MPYSTETLTKVREIEQELGPRNTPIEKGLYHFRFTDESEVMVGGGFPLLRLEAEIIEGDVTGRKHSEFLRWYAKEDATAKKSWEDRTKSARAMTLRFLSTEKEKPIGVVQACAGSPITTQSWAAQLDDAIAVLKGTDKPQDTEEAFETIGGLLADVDFYGRIEHQEAKDAVTKKPTGTVWERLALVDYEQGESQPAF